MKAYPMLITLKNKDTLILGDFTFKCSIGANGVKAKKKEGDRCTPRGIFSLGKLYYRPDRVEKPQTKISTICIRKNMVWCNDVTSHFYNTQIKVNKRIKHEKLFRKDNSYDYLIVINYNTKDIKKEKGSAIFLHLTKTYKNTAGCVAVKKKDLLIILKLISNKSKIKIN